MDLDILHNSSQKKLNDFNKSLLIKKKSDVFHKIYYNIISYSFFYKHKQLLKYLSVGLVGVIVDFVLLYLFTEFLGLFYLISATLSYIFGITANFILNKKYTFKFEQNKFRKNFKAFSSYFIVSISSMVITLLFMSLAVEFLNLDYMFAKIIISLLMLSYRYGIHSRCFRK
jgi:putative flippase GtrA